MEKRENDLRYKKTEKLIRKVFRDMIQEMDYGEITIKALTERAEINRKTFYLHYPSLDALLGKMQAELMARFMRPITTAIFPDDLESIVRNFFEFSASADTVEEKILCSKVSFPLGENPIEAAQHQIREEHECFPGLKEPEKKIVLAYLTGGVCEIYKQWVLDGQQIPLENIIQIATSLLANGLFHSGVLPESAK